MAAPTSPDKIGNVKFRIKLSLLVFRHANNGPIPVKAKRINPMGILI